MGALSKPLRGDLEKQAGNRTRQFRLDSGRKLVIHSNPSQDLVEIWENDADAIVQIRLTEQGPVVSVQGAKLELSAADEILMQARKIEIHSQEQARVTSRGGIDISTKENVNIASKADIRLKSKTIHLN